MFQPYLLVSHVVKFAVVLHLIRTSDAFSVDQELSKALSLRLIDIQTNSSPLSVLFLNKKTTVIVRGISWTGDASTTSLKYTTFLNEEEVAHGSIALSSDPLELPTTINAGTIVVTDGGSSIVRVVLNDGSTEGTNVDMAVRAFSQWYAILPVAASFVSFLLFNLEMEVALFLSIFCGSWIIQGSFFRGFTAIFQIYLLEAMSESSHVAILLFIGGIFVLMKLIDKRGGTNEMLHLISPYTNRTRIAQMALVGIGLVFYFDSLTSILVVGTIFGSIIKGFPISCEKLSFIVHSTALPLASIIPGSTWIVQTSNLLQHELDKVAILDDTMETTGKSMIINSIKYQFYPILMLALVFILLMADRDAGPLLGAENRARSNYAIVEKNMDALFSRRGMGSREERSWNWWIPVAILTGSLWYTFVRISGAAEDANIYSISSALMVCPATTAVLVQLLFFFQTQIRGSLGCCGYHEKSVKENVTFLSDTFPSASTSKSDVEQRHDEMESQKQTETLNQNSSSRHVDKSGRSDESEGTTSRPRSHIEEVVGCLIGGMNSCAQIFVALIFTWAASGMFTELGVGRLVVSWILEDSVSHEVLPIVAYCSALLLSLMLGNALRTVSILIPALTVPLYQSIGGNSVTFVVTLASILSGAITGDHIGPFSDTTILSGLVSGGDTRCHFITQAPYAIFVLVVSVGTGVVPMSYDVYPDFVGYLVGLGIFVAFVILACRKVDMPPIVLGRAAEAITQTLHKNIEVGRRENLSVIHSPDNYETLIIGESEDDPSTRTEEHCKQVYTSESIAATEKVDNTQTALSLKSFKSKLKDVTESGRDPIEGLVEIGILHRNVRSELYGHGRNIPRSGGGRFIGSSHSEADFAPMAIIQNKKKLIEATIKKAENDGNIFSDSLRMFLRSAEKKIDSLMDEESLEIQASESNEVSLDDSLDHLMSGIASNDWRVVVDALQGSNHDDDADGSTRGDYSTDGASSGVESDDSASASSSSSAGKSTAFTGDGATAYTVDGESTSRATSVGPSIATAEFSDLKSPLEFGKSRKVLPAWLDGEMSVASSCSDVRESRASF